MKRLVYFKTFASVVLILFLQTYICESQEAFDKLFKSSEDRISEIVNQDYQVIHLDLDRLNSNDKNENKISLHTGYKYIFAACGDQDRIESVKIELFEESGGKRNPIRTGRDGIVPEGSSVINFEPDMDKNYLVTVAPDKFTADNITAGRYYLIVASKPIYLEFKTLTKEEVKYNLLSDRYVYKNSIGNNSVFIVNSEGNIIKHIIDDSNTIEYSIQMTNTDEPDKGYLKCQVQGPDNKTYSFMIDRINKSIVILDQPGRNNVFTGFRYHLQ